MTPVPGRSTADGGPTTSLSLMMGIPSPDMAMLAIQAGCDAIILDCEHGFPMDGQLRSAILAVKVVGGKCLVRIARRAVDQVAVLADIGADGVVLSGPEKISEVERLLDLATFPMMGTRSINPFVPAAGTPGDAEALTLTGDAFELWTMAETAAFVKDLSAPEIWPASLERWTGIIIGPYDLAGALGCATSPEDPRLLEAVSVLTNAARGRGLNCGLFVRDAEVLRRWGSLGITPGSVVLGYDRDVWFQECARRVKDAHAVAELSLAEELESEEVR